MTMPSLGFVEIEQKAEAMLDTSTRLKSLWRQRSKADQLEAAVKV